MTKIYHVRSRRSNKSTSFGLSLSKLRLTKVWRTNGEIFCSIEFYICGENFRINLLLKVWEFTVVREF
jgi:hypothetical protein